MTPEVFEPVFQLRTLICKMEIIKFTPSPGVGSCEAQDANMNMTLTFFLSLPLGVFIGKVQQSVTSKVPVFRAEDGKWGDKWNN